MGPKPVTPDLAALWRDLGLRPRGEALEFDDSAPLAAIRKAITAKPARDARGIGWPFARDWWNISSNREQEIDGGDRL